MSRALGLRLLWGVCLIVVIIGSLLPGNSAPMLAIESLGVSDKLEHCAAYAVLAFLPCVYERRRVVAMLLTLAAAIGVLLEFGQLFSPARSFDVYDMLADGIGVMIGAAVAVPVRLRFAASVHNGPDGALDLRNERCKSLVESGK
jgi:VanZ family protein